MLSVIGCTHRAYVPVEKVSAEVRVDTVRMASVRRDSVYVRDSIYVEGHAVVKERWREKFVYRTDTCYRVRADTVRVYVEKPVVVEVPRKRGTMKKLLGAVVVGLLALAAIRLKRKI